jgi:hypothetical protein
MLLYVGFHSNSHFLCCLWIIRISHFLLLFLESKTCVAVFLMLLLSQLECCTCFLQFPKHLVLIPRGIIVIFLQSCPFEGSSKSFAYGLCCCFSHQKVGLANIVLGIPPCQVLETSHPEKFDRVIPFAPPTTFLL